MARHKPAKPQRRSLARGRPPATKPPRSMSRRASRTLINTHHQLEKQKLQASNRGDKTLESEISAQMVALGGLGQYQEASLQGQRHDRGGDTSKVLLEWLRAFVPKNRKARMLEVGALSTRNACSCSGLFDMVLIDLNSRDRAIVQQDFMDRPPPADCSSDGFEVISLSLVLNFVPTSHDRGKMLRHTLSFLRRVDDWDRAHADSPFPCLFIVLPRQCVYNSRYFSGDQFDALMATLGFVRERWKLTGKLIYSLWRKDSSISRSGKRFVKEEVNPGKTRNNFSIALESLERDNPYE